MGLAVLPQILLHRLVGPVAVLKHDESLHALHLERVLHADHTAALDGRMPLDNILKLRRIHVVSAGDDHPFDPLAEIDEAFVVHLAQIARVKPHMAVLMHAHRLLVLLLMADVTQHHRRSGEADFAFLAKRQLITGARFADLEISVRERNADGTFLLLVVWRQAAGGHALGRAVTFAHTD